MTNPNQPEIRPRPMPFERPIPTPRPEIRPVQPPPERRGLDGAALSALHTAGHGAAWTAGAIGVGGVAKLAHEKIAGGGKKKE